MLKRILRFSLKTLLVLFGLVLVFLLFAIGFVDRTPANDFAGYSKTLDEAAHANVRSYPGDSLFLIGFSKINLTPSEPVALAGYGNRKGKKYTSVADSIFVRTMVIDNGSTKVAIVTADLLLIPPRVTEALELSLESIGFSAQNVFLGATHTHNSIGNWGEGAAGFIYGPYEQQMVDFITSRILHSITVADKEKSQGKIRFGKIGIPSAVENRLLKNGPEDPYLRVLEVNRKDSTKLLLMSYSAHATCLYSKNLELSRDYPGKLVDQVEADGYSFAMFMAGSVGSHKPAAPEYGWQCFDWMANEISTALHDNIDSLADIDGTEIAVASTQLHLSDPQVKLTKDLKVRSWLFRSALGEYPVYVKTLRMGDLVMVGVPADFSGEFDARLDSVAATSAVKLMITSFNGGYIGYLTPMKYYENKYFETQLMNWYAPGTGEFVSEVMMEAIDHIKK